MMIAVLERLVYGLSKQQIPARYQKVYNLLLVKSYNINNPISNNFCFAYRKKFVINYQVLNLAVNENKPTVIPL